MTSNLDFLENFKMNMQMNVIDILRDVRDDLCLPSAKRISSGIADMGGHSRTLSHDKKIFDMIFRDEYANELEWFSEG